MTTGPTSANPNPAPDAATKERPGGSVSVTVAAPVVTAVPTLRATSR